MVSILGWNTVSVANIGGYNSAFIKMKKRAPKVFKEEKETSYFQTYHICLFDCTLRFIRCSQALHLAQELIQSLAQESSQALGTRKQINSAS